MKHLRAALCFGLLALPLAAQSPSDRQALVAFRDTLYHIGKADSLDALDLPKEVRSADKSREAFLQLRQGFLLLRRADLTAEFVFLQMAADELGDLTDHHLDWPYAWFGHGLAELGKAEGQLPVMLNLARAFGKDPLRRAKADMTRSVAVDSLFAEEVATFVVTAVRQQHELRLDVSLGVVQATDTMPGGHSPALLLARGMVERSAGSVDAALAALSAYRQRRPDEPLGLLESAAALFQAGRFDGIALWYRGLLLADDATLALYRDDLATLMPDSMLAAFDAAATGMTRVAVARRFWDSRDRDGLPTSEERLREHYIRLTRARHDFTPALPAALIEPLPLVNTAMDDRGAIYVRDGAPDIRTYVDLPGVRPNETWWYQGRGGDTLLFNFSVRPPYPGYRMVPSLFDILANSGQAKVAGRYQKDLSPADSSRPVFETYGAALLAQTAQELLLFRKDIPLYGRMMGAGIKESAALQAEERELGDRSIALEESWRFGYEIPLQAAVELVALGRDPAGPLLQIAFAVPSSGIIPARAGRGFVYPVRLRAAALGPDGAVVATIDTTRLFFSMQRIPTSSHLLGRLPLHLPPGTYSVRVAIESGLIGTITPKQDVRVAALDRPALALSDLALGTPSVRLSLPGLKGETAWINPLQTYSRKTALVLYAEIGGLTAGAAYHTDVEIVRVGSNGERIGKEGQSVRLGFDGRKSNPVDGMKREISLSKLAPGNYTLTVTVSTSAGERVTRQRRFTLVKE